MAKLTAAARRKIPAKKFALPGGRFPVEDKTHARVAKSYASRMAANGQLSLYDKARVYAAADRELHGTKKAAAGARTSASKARSR